MTRLVKVDLTLGLKEAILTGRACCAWTVKCKEDKKHPEKRGQVGDYFYVEDRLYQIVGVHNRCIQDLFVSNVTLLGYRDEESRTAKQAFTDSATRAGYPRETWGTLCTIYYFAYVGDNSQTPDNLTIEEYGEEE